MGLRAGEPDISPDGRRLVAVITERGNQNLALLDAAQLLAGKQPIPSLITAYREERVSSPRWSPDGRQIVYALTDNNGTTVLRLLKVEDGSDRELMRTTNSLVNPSWARDGSYVLYAGDETGVFNLYACDIRNGKSRQITHLLSGAFQPDIAPDGSSIVFAHYHSDGFTIASLDTSPADWWEGRTPTIMDARTGYPQMLAQPAVTDGNTKPALKKNDYNPLETLRPRFWMPTLKSYGSETLMAGALTAGQDALGYHAYMAEVLYGPKYEKIYSDIIYRYDRWFPTLTLRGYALPASYANLQGYGDYVELDKGLITKLTLPVLNLESSFSLDLGYQIQEQDALTTLSGATLNGLPVFQGRRSNIFVGLNYSNSLKYPWSISHDEGRNISLLYRNYSKSLGGVMSPPGSIRRPGRNTFLFRENS